MFNGRDRLRTTKKNQKYFLDYIRLKTVRLDLVLFETSTARRPYLLIFFFFPVFSPVRLLSVFEKRAYAGHRPRPDGEIVSAYYFPRASHARSFRTVFSYFRTTRVSTLFETFYCSTIILDPGVNNHEGARARTGIYGGQKKKNRKKNAKKKYNTLNTTVYRPAAVATMTRREIRIVNSDRVTLRITTTGPWIVEKFKQNHKRYVDHVDETGVRPEETIINATSVRKAPAFINFRNWKT